LPNEIDSVEYRRFTFARCHFVIAVLVGCIKLINCTSICRPAWTQHTTDWTASGRLSIQQRYIAWKITWRRRVLSSTSLARRLISFLHSSAPACSSPWSRSSYSCCHLKVEKRSHCRLTFYCHSQFSRWFCTEACRIRPILCQLYVSVPVSPYNFHIRELKLANSIYQLIF